MNISTQRIKPPFQTEFIDHSHGALVISLIDHIKANEILGETFELQRSE